MLARIGTPSHDEVVELELSSLHEKLRELQLEISQLHREIQGREEEHNKLSLLLSRRMTILSNIVLSVWTLFARTFQSFARRQRVVRELIYTA
jgi:hypothetical protein